MCVPASRGAVRLTLSFLIFVFVLGSPGIEWLASAQAQSVPKSLEEGGSDAAMKLRKNNWTVGVAGGQLSGTYMTFANEMAEVLDDGDNLRVIPIVTYGAASNLDDLLYLQQVDVAVVGLGAYSGLTPSAIPMATPSMYRPRFHFSAVLPFPKTS